MEGVDFHMREVKEMTKKEYISRVCKILKADMIGEHTMQAICAFALPVLSGYTIPKVMSIAYTYTVAKEEED
eukprot:6785653-Ditylum_brightwellii.AAC.1